MKRIVSVSPIVLFALYCFIPLCLIIGALSGYTFILNNANVFTFVYTSVVLLLTVLSFKFDIQVGKMSARFALSLAPLSAINGLYFIAVNQWKAKFIFVFMCCVCSFIMLFNYGKPLWGKVVCAILGIILSLLLLFYSFLNFIFGGFGSNTVIRSVPSPKNTYIAKVIDNDQGALGGATFVDIYSTKPPINFLICQFSKSPIRLYQGRWGEDGSLDIIWESESKVKIDGKKYNLKK